MFRREWVILNLSKEISEKEILFCIKMAKVPECFKFSFGDPARVEKRKWGDSTWPWGIDDWTIVVHDYTDPEYPKGDINAVGGAFGNRCTIAYLGYEWDIEIGARIWHEMLHCMGVNSDNLETVDRVRFCEWLLTNPKEICEEWKSSSITHCRGFGISSYAFQMVLCSYYTMLTKELCQDCYPQNNNEPDKEGLLAGFFRRVIEYIKRLFNIMR